MKNLGWSLILFTIFLSLASLGCVKNTFESQVPTGSQVPATSNVTNEAESLPPVLLPPSLKQYGWHDTSVIVSVDEQFQITVGEEGSFMWGDVVFDNSMLQLINKSFERPGPHVPGSVPPPGYPWEITYTYKALQVGSTEIKMTNESLSGPENDQILIFYVTIQ